MIFPISKTKYRIIKEVYENPNIRISELLRKANVSQSHGYRYVQELLNAGIIKQNFEGKKPVSRLLEPNFSDVGKLCFSLLEEEKRINFFIKHKELMPQFIHFKDEISKFIDSALIFGSFARNAENKDSDVDILVIAKETEKKQIEKIVERCFVTLKRRVSIRFITKEELIKAIKKDEFYKQILKHHLIISNSFNFIQLIAEL